MPASEAGTEPRAPKKQLCSFFVKTGSCAFGDRCKFEHPDDQPPTSFNSLGLPLREGEPECAYYVENLHCGYGASCKFHHAEPVMGWVAVPAQGPSHLPQLPPPPQAMPPVVPGYLASPTQLGQQSRLSALNQALYTQNYHYSMMQQPYIANEFGPGMMPLAHPVHPLMPSMVQPSPQARPPIASPPVWSLPHRGMPSWATSHPSAGPFAAPSDEHQLLDESIKRAPAGTRRGGNFGEVPRPGMQNQPKPGPHNQ